MKELLARKDREMTEMSRELCCLRNTLKEQKKIIEHLNHELNTEEKCRNRCSELELQVKCLKKMFIFFFFFAKALNKRLVLQWYVRVQSRFNLLPEIRIKFCEIGKDKELP